MPQVTAEQAEQFEDFSRRRQAWHMLRSAIKSHTDQKTANWSIASFFCAVLLFSATGPHSYAYYVALRTVVTLVAAIFALEIAAPGRWWLLRALPYAVIAFTFNPFGPFVGLAASTWRLIDGATAVLLLIGAYWRAQSARIGDEALVEGIVRSAGVDPSR